MDRKDVRRFGRTIRDFAVADTHRALNALVEVSSGVTFDPALRNDFKLKLFWLNPQLIEYQIFEPVVDSVKLILERSFVSPGPWDRLRTLHRIPPIIRALVIHGDRIRESNAYDQMRADVIAGNVGRYPTLESFEERLDGLIAAHRGIVNHGYQPQGARGRSRTNEIGIYVSRDGRLIWGQQGFHRLSMAKLLGLESVPMIVWGVHRRWARRCVGRYGTSHEGAITGGLRELGATWSDFDAVDGSSE